MAAAGIGPINDVPVRSPPAGMRVLPSLLDSLWSGTCLRSSAESMPPRRYPRLVSDAEGAHKVRDPFRKQHAREGFIAATEGRRMNAADTRGAPGGGAGARRRAGAAQGGADRHHLRADRRHAGRHHHAARQVHPGAPVPGVLELLWLFSLGSKAMQLPTEVDGLVSVTAGGRAPRVP